MPKCECICFQAQNVHVDQEFDAQLYRERIPHVPVLRYLGVWFDEGLTWAHHVGVATARARERLWLVCRLGGRGWVLDPHLFLRLVRGAVFPLLFFGATCWASVLCFSIHLL